MMMALKNSMEGQSLTELVAGFGIVTADDERAVRGLSVDSRLIEDGSLFLACRGQNTSGVNFIDDAVRRGAVAAAVDMRDLAQARGAPVPVIPVRDLSACAGRIAARFYGEPSRHLRVVGVTGTNGKTSVTHYIASALGRAENGRAGIIGTLGYGPAARLRPTLLTTPDAVTIQRELADMRAQGVTAVAMEVSSHALQQHRVDGVNFDTAVFTNLTRDHLDYHGSMEDYAAAKQMLFEVPGLRRAVVNLDDPFGRELFRRIAPEAVKVGYRLLDDFAASPAPACLEGRLLENLPGSLALAVRGPWGSGDLRSALTGRFNASNVLATLAVLCLQDVPLATAMDAVSAVHPVAGRMETFGGGGKPTVVVDYAHTPDALEQALRALRPGCRGRLHCVFGCGGDRDRGKRPQMGKVAAALSDHVVVTSDNPRSESPEAIIDEILEGIPGTSVIDVVPDRAEAIRLAVESAAVEDVILIAGKGHETYQEIQGRRYPFSDRELVRRLLEERS